MEGGNEVRQRRTELRIRRQANIMSSIRNLFRLSQLAFPFHFNRKRRLCQEGRRGLIDNKNRSSIIIVMLTDYKTKS